MENTIKRIGVLTSGGDSPGMNAAVRAVVRTAVAYGIECVGIRRGWQGLINADFVQLSRESVGHILSRGGTILYTARSDDFMTEHGRKRAVATCKMLGLDAIVAGTPTTGTPRRESSSAPRKVPSPPMATMASRPSILQVVTAFCRPSSDMKSSLRAVKRIVPPRERMCPTLVGVSRVKSALIKPCQPLRMPMHSMPQAAAVRTTARMAGFMPGASPPLVNTPILLTLFIVAPP